MWNLSGVLSSLAMKRRSVPSGLASTNWKLPVCRRTSTGTESTAAATGTPSGAVFRPILTRCFQSGFHAACDSVEASNPNSTKPSTTSLFMTTELTAILGRTREPIRALFQGCESSPCRLSASWRWRVCGLTTSISRCAAEAMWKCFW